jgi:two-component system, NtrC family, response regulator HydG
MMTKQAHMLVVDDDAGHLATLQTIIRSWGYRVSTADNGSAAVAMVKEQPFDMILMDVRMAEMDGIEALRQIKAYNPAIPILIMTAYSSVAAAVDAIKAGAYDYLTKPLDFETLRLTMERAMEHTHLKVENRQLKEKLRDEFDWQNIIGTSPPMKALIDMLAMVAPSDATVMITGESGTGKELIARSIHYNSRRRAAPCVIVNCAALADTLLESELFGHEKGAFTGADKRREGRFRQADGGTLFLDEIGETSSAMQAKLLRVIQEREFQRVGGDETLSVDVRILAATNRDLKAEVRNGKFREDLFYRLNVVTVEVPPLSARHEDIPLLAQNFMERFATRNRKTVKGFTPQAMDLLIKHDWPGNVRELENAVERSVILLAGDYITERELPLSITQTGDGGRREAARPENEGLGLTGSQSLETIEKEAILATLSETGGNKSETARRLGINRKTLHLKLKRYGLA